MAESSRGFRQEIALLEAHIHCLLEVNLDRLYFPFSLKVEKGGEWEGGVFTRSLVGYIDLEVCGAVLK